MNNRRQSQSAKLPNSRCPSQAWKLLRAFIGVDGRNKRIQDGVSIFTDSQLVSQITKLKFVSRKVFPLGNIFNRLIERV